MWWIVLGLFVVAAAILSGRLLRWAIRRRLSGYVRVETEGDERLPQRIASEKRVAVIGAGVAGLTAAVTLARRGYSVTLLDRNEYLGGKLGSWNAVGCRGHRLQVSHGFHAFFPHYYNLNRLLDSLELRRDFASIGDYVILGKGGQVLRFRGLDETPVFNLLSLMRKGMFSLGDALRAPGRDLYGVFLEYEQAETFARYDSMSYAQFSDLSQVPPRLKVAFNTFARAFFASEDRLSFAELVKSFHFYYLSHDGGLVYDYPRRDYEKGLLLPLREHLEGLGARIQLGQSVQHLLHQEEGFSVDGESFDKIIVATDVVGAQKLLGSADFLPPTARSNFQTLSPGQRYAVYRIWLDRDARLDLPVFVITERTRVLDSVTFFHRFEEETMTDVEARASSEQPVKAVLELHCYSVPDELPDEEVSGALIEELEEHFPELAGAAIVDQHFQLRRDFTAFHVGMNATRPETSTGAAGLYCAGDWVKLPFPAMLLEGACASGLLAANAILREDGIREEMVLSVPLRGLLAGMKAPPTRQRLLERHAERGGVSKRN